MECAGGHCLHLIMCIYNIQPYGKNWEGGHEKCKFHFGRSPHQQVLDHKIHEDTNWLEYKHGASMFVHYLADCQKGNFENLRTCNLHYPKTCKLHLGSTPNFLGGGLKHVTVHFPGSEISGEKNMNFLGPKNVSYIFQRSPP